MAATKSQSGKSHDKSGAATVEGCDQISSIGCGKMQQCKNGNGFRTATVLE